MEALFLSSQNTTSSVRLDSDPMKSADQAQSTDESFSANSIFHGRQSMPLTNLGRKLWHEGQRPFLFSRSNFFREEGSRGRETRGFPHNTRQKQHSEILWLSETSWNNEIRSPRKSIPRLNSRRVRKSRDFDSLESLQIARSESD